MHYVSDIDWDSRNLIIIREYVHCGDLDAFIINNDPLIEEDPKAMARQILDVLSYLHRNLIVHQNVKPSNILIQSL